MRVIAAFVIGGAAQENTDDNEYILDNKSSIIVQLVHCEKN